MLRRFGQIVTVVALITTICGVARANGIIDPAMKVLYDEFSDSISQGLQFQPNSGGGGVFGFFNATGHSITELTFETLIQPNIDPTDIASAFVCNQGNFNPFFLFCRVDYLQASGRLTIAFWGTNQAPAVDHLGVAPLPTGCTAANADSPGCTGSGHFAISLNDDFSLTPSTGGWSESVNPLLFPPGGPTFTVTEIQTMTGAVPLDIAAVPEPGTIWLVACALAGMTWIVNKRRRSHA
jgi:hypothetical protein